MRKLLLMAVAFLLSLASFSQTSLYNDDFESYTVGSYIAESNPTWWTTWGNAPGTGEDGYVSDDFASSPTKSLFIDPDDGLTDLILKLGNKTSGAYFVNWDMYVEAGYQGYYNFQHFESPGIEWAFDVWFYDDGTGELMVGNVKYPFTYTPATWVTVEHEINIDADLAKLIINGVEVHSWPFSYETQGTAGTNQLGGIDFWTDDNTYRYYIDDLNYAPMPVALYEDDFESYTAGDYIAVENPTWWTTWSNNPGSAEDGLISADQAHSPVNSVLIDKVPAESDLILKLGDRTSGAYNLAWQMYVATNMAGYYNIQHFETPGIEWAYEVYFLANGNGELYAGSTTPITFTYPKNTWFLVENQINIDEDLAILVVNGVEVHSWPFHYEADGMDGTNQLGGVDFFAGAKTGETPKYYFDDVEFVQFVGASDPVMTIDPVTISTSTPSGSFVDVPLTITNDGAADLNYQVSVIYPAEARNTAPVKLEGETAPVRTLGYNNGVSSDPDPRPASYNPPPSDDFVLHYDGDNFSAIGWNSVPISPTVAAMFPTNLTLPHAGMMLTSVDVYINDPGENYILKIYDMGTTFYPGELLVSQPFSGVALSWNSIELNNPVYITGADLWVGYQFTQTVAETFTPGTDGGPANPNGDFISSGVGWSHLSDNPELNYNWNIRANLSGTPIEQWLTVDVASGTITPGNSATITVTCDASSLTAGTYEAALRIVSNDPENLQVDVPVTLEVTEGGTPYSVVLDFEAQEDFSLTFDPWTAVDEDGGATYGFEGIEFPHAYEPMAFIAFNPNSTVPSLSDDPELQPHGGARFGAAMATVPPPYNSDWLISPQIALGMNSSVSMWVKSYTDEYGLEKYNVLVSTTDMNPASFTSVSGSTPMQAPVDWTEVTFDLSDYDGQTVYVAIQCVSEDAWVFMLDDVSVDFLVGTPESEMETEFSIYPNPVHNQLNIVSETEMNEIRIFNQLGQMVYNQVVKDNYFTMNTLDFNAGVYFVQITTGKGTTTQKFIVK